MSDGITPQGEAIRRAVAWISEMRQGQQAMSTVELVDEAGRRFNLSPREQLSLMRLLAPSRKDDAG